MFNRDESLRVLHYGGRIDDLFIRRKYIISVGFLCVLGPILVFVG